MSWEIIAAHGITDLIDAKCTLWIPVYSICLWLSCCQLAGLQVLIWVSALHFNNDVELGVIIWALLLTLVINTYRLLPGVGTDIVYIGMALHTINHLQRDISWSRTFLTSAFAYILYASSDVIKRLPFEIIEGIVLSHCLTQHFA